MRPFKYTAGPGGPSSPAALATPLATLTNNAPAGDQYVWGGSASGDWTDAANWQDTTSGQNPAIVAPGSLDHVSLGHNASGLLTITGVGDAADLFTQNPLAIDGSITVSGMATLAWGGFGSSLAVDSGGRLSAGSVDCGGDLIVGGSGAVLTTGSLLIDASGPASVVSRIDATGGAVVLLGTLQLGVMASITVDATSIIDIGGTSGTVGALTVERGTSVRLFETSVSGTVVDDGVIQTRSSYAPNGTLHSDMDLVRGSGTLELTAASALTIQRGIAGSLTVQVDNGATLALGGTASSASGIALTGHDVLDLSHVSLTGMAATIAGFDGSDTIGVLGQAVTSAAYATGISGAPGTLTLFDGGTAVETLRLAGDYTGESFVTTVIDATETDVTVISGITACFAEGTRIATPHGPCAVESLRAGDLVLTAGGASAPVVWLGHRRIACARHPRPHDVSPVRVRAHAFAHRQPARDLLLSPDHAVFAGGVLIPVRYLLNGASVAQESVAHVTYWHVELPAHGLLLAEGLACESYLDTGNRSAFANGGGAVMAHPDFARGVWAAQSCAALRLSGPPVDAVRADLLARLPALGFAVTTDPALRVSADGVTLEPQCFGEWLTFAMPRNAATLRLRSRDAAPAELALDSDDTRRLGIALIGLRLDGEAVALDDARLVAGWHAAEPGLRWTGGDALIRLDGASIVELALAPERLRYSVPAAPASRAA